MELKFCKYQGTGNDFILVDNLSGNWNSLSIDQIKLLCDRKFGVGADGLIKINALQNFDFEVDYYNADGTQSFCGNGARCAVAFAHELGITQAAVSFLAIDGPHQALKKNGLIELKMSDVSDWNLRPDSTMILNTGSPHLIKWCAQVKNQAVVEIGKSIRYSTEFEKEGINVNLVEIITENKLAIRTYERGVEDETLSCGTGVTAAAIAFAIQSNKYGKTAISLATQGGELTVNFNRVSENIMEEIWLTGPAKHVFSGVVTI